MNSNNFNGFEFEEFYGGLCITAYKGEENNIKIPRYFEGKEVIKICSEAFNNCEYLLSITIPNNILIIEDNAFSDSPALIYCETEAEPDSWEDGWNDRAPDRCPVIWDCKNNDMADDGNLYYTEGGIRYVLKNNVAEVVYVCRGIEDVTIPAEVFYNWKTYKVKSISATIYDENYELERLTISEGVERIEEYAFCNAFSLAKVIVPNTVKYIGKFAFDDCSNRLIIYCDAKVKPEKWNDDWKCEDYPVVWDCKNNKIANDGNMYYEAPNGIRYTLKDKVATVVKQPYRLSGIIAVPSTVICDKEYYTVEKINKAAFEYSDSLSIILPDSIINMESEIFYGCKNLKYVRLPKNLNKIVDMLFDKCISLTEYSIPDSITSIGNCAFYGCANLAKLEIPKSVINIHSRAFDYCDDSLIFYCEAESQPSGWGNNWNHHRPVVWNYKNNEVASDGNIYYKSNNEIIYGLKDGLATVARQTTLLSGAKIIPSQVTYKGATFDIISVDNGAFFNCSSITSIKVPSSIMSIGIEAFSYCSSLERITVDENNVKYKSEGNCIIEKETNKLILGCKNSVLPNCITNIDSAAFEGCSSLTSIIIPSSVTSIGNYAFKDCSSLTSIEIPSGVTSIGYNAFEECSSLTSIEIPSSVTSIGDYAFRGCSSLTIYCEAESKPSGWSSGWNINNRPVVWGYKIK